MPAARAKRAYWLTAGRPSNKALVFKPPRPKTRTGKTDAAPGGPDVRITRGCGTVGSREILIVLEVTSGNGRETAAPANAGQHRTALMSVFAAAALVVLKLGTGLVTGSLGLVSAGH